MEPEIPQKTAPEPLLAAWIKWTMDFWEAMAQMGPGLPRAGGAPGPPPAAEDYGQSALKLWQAFFSLLSDPHTVSAVFQGINPPSEIILKMAQAGWGGYFHLYQQWLAGVGGTEPAAENYCLENLDQDIFKICTEIYEKDFREFLNLPQLGLTRFSQERVSRAMEKFGQFQAAMAEFIYQLYLPLKKSLRAMQGIREAEDFKEYYRQWLKILEGYYMNLLKSPEYNRTLSHTLNALEDFNLAKQELLSDALQALAIPTQRDMDDLYREIYLLKKKVKELAKKLAQLEPAGEL
jgi:class III poly(R)-hydroxyalkanoic acid synthase PhaE subunit